MRAREAVPLATLGLILGLTAALWALALWPLPTDAPLWLARTRAVCFGSASGGLPDASGWLVLVVQPGIMLGILFAAWGRTLASGLSAAAGSAAGRWLLGASALALTIGIGAAAWRVARAMDRGAAGPEADPPATYPRLGHPAPVFNLIDQHGATTSLARFRGRPVIVTFAYAHCETVCPLVVHDVIEARRAVARLNPVALIITLDPDRDVPSRLVSIARQWKLGSSELVLSGTADAVNLALDAWNVPRVRDLRTGEVIHPRLVYLVDAEGRIAYATTGGARAVASLLERR